MKSFIKWFRGLFQCESLNFDYRFVDDVPSKISSKTIYLIGTYKEIWAILFKCPCGCKEDVTLNALSNAKPCWSCYIEKSRISISPSINRIIGCRSHFTIKEGMVDGF